MKFTEIELDDVDRDEIAAETDVEKLRVMYGRYRLVASELKEFISAQRFAEVGEEDWFERASGKVAFCCIGAKHCERRILELGGEVPYPPTDPRVKAIRDLERINKELRREILELKETSLFPKAA